MEMNSFSVKQKKEKVIKVLRETIICIIIIVAIIGLHIFTQGYTVNSMEEMREILEEIKGDVIAENKEEIQNKTKELDSTWLDKYDKLAYYIEHDELEKVNVSIENMKSYVETEDYSSAIAAIDEGKFILKHIEEKDAFDLKNIF